MRREDKQQRNINKDSLLDDKCHEYDGPLIFIIFNNDRANFYHEYFKCFFSSSSSAAIEDDFSYLESEVGSDTNPYQTEIGPLQNLIDDCTP